MRSKNKLIARFSIIILFLPAVVLFSQDIQEKLLEDQKTKNTMILERLEDIKANPLNINSASEKTINAIPFFDNISARKIIRERKKNGDFKSLSDFQSRMHFDTDFVKLISSYIRFDKMEKSTPLSVSFRNRYMRKLEKEKGFSTNKFKGPPVYTYNRMTLSKGPFSSKILIHKDPGEASYADHFVGYAELHIKKHGLKIIAGNFIAETGQGLTLWGPYSQYKGANSVKAAKNRTSGISGYALSTEFGYMQGIALSLYNRHFSLTGFYSKAHKDASLNNDSTVSSFKKSGLHRTEYEIKTKGNACESNICFSASYINKNNSAGFTIMHARFSPPLNPEINERKQFEFKGQKLFVYGAHWDIEVKNVNLYGELSESDPGSCAIVTGAATNIGLLKLAFVYYYFSKKFYSPYSSFMSISPAKNRQGIYCGMKRKFSRRISASFYLDFHHTPWRTYFIPVPFNSSDIFSQWELKLSHKVKILLRFNKKTGARAIKDTHSSEPLVHVASTSLYKFRSGISYSPSKKIRFRARFEAVRFSINGSYYESIKHGENGFLFFADGLIKPFHKSFVNLRAIVFDTESWDTRIYEFERDLPGVLSNTPLYNRGERIYIIFALNPFKSFKLSAKWSLTFYPGRTYLRSGYNMIYGNKINKIGVQGDIYF